MGVSVRSLSGQAHAQWYDTNPHLPCSYIIWADVQWVSTSNVPSTHACSQSVLLLVTAYCHSMIAMIGSIVIRSCGSHLQKERRKWGRVCKLATTSNMSIRLQFTEGDMHTVRSLLELSSGSNFLPLTSFSFLLSVNLKPTCMLLTSFSSSLYSHS